MTGCNTNSALFVGKKCVGACTLFRRMGSYSPVDVASPNTARSLLQNEGWFQGMYVYFQRTVFVFSDEKFLGILPLSLLCLLIAKQLIQHHIEIILTKM